MNYYTFKINRCGRVFNNSFPANNEYGARAIAMKHHGADSVKECLGRWDFEQKKLVPIVGGV